MFTINMDGNDKPIVSVLLSTYNGHKYLRELIDSVLAQEDVNVRIQVRDDGSTDDTIAILKSYNDPRISIRTGKNLKPALSFLTLLRECDDSDYYAYCDQDDYWYTYKLITAINELKGVHEPALFISTEDNSAIYAKAIGYLFTKKDLIGYARRTIAIANRYNFEEVNVIMKSHMSKSEFKKCFKEQNI